MCHSGRVVYRGYRRAIYGRDGIRGRRRLGEGGRRRKSLGVSLRPAHASLVQQGHLFRRHECLIYGGRRYGRHQEDVVTPWLWLLNEQRRQGIFTYCMAWMCSVMATTCEHHPTTSSQMCCSTRSVRDPIEGPVAM